MAEIRHIKPTAVIARRAIEGVIADLQAALEDPAMTAVYFGAEIIDDTYAYITQKRSVSDPVFKTGRLVEPKPDGNSDA